MKIIFVYNADSGLLNTVKDIGHKLFQPDTYDCFLCSLTHGTFRENPQWKDFRENSGLDMEFLHRDEFEKHYSTSFEYPVILENTDPLKVIISKDELEAFTSLDQLIGVVSGFEGR